MVMLIENAVGGEQYNAIIKCYTSHDTIAVK